MSKKIAFTVCLTFEDKIVSDNDFIEIAENVAASIEHSANTCGIAPENSDTYLKEIEVANSGLILKTITL